MNKQERFTLIEAAKWTSIASLFGVILNLSFNSLLAYTASPETVGAVLAFIALGTLISQFLQFGLQTSAVKMVSGYLTQNMYQNASYIAKKTFKVIFANSVCAFFFLILVSYFYKPQNFNFFQTSSSILIPLLLTIFAFSLSIRNVEASVARAFQRNAQATFFGTLLPSLLQLLFLALLAIVVTFPMVSEIIIILVLAHLLSSLLSLRFTMRFLSPGQCNGRYSTKIIYQSGSLFLANGFIFTLFSQLGILYLQYVDSYAELAIYGVPSRLMITISVPVVMLMQYLSPYFSKSLTEGDHKGVSNIAKASSTICFFYYLFLVVFFYLFGERALSILFGEFYAQTNDIMLVLLMGNMISVSFGFVIKIIEMSHYQCLSLVPGIISIAISIITMPIAYEKYSAIGIALSISFGVIISRAIGCLLVLKYLNISTFGFIGFFKFTKVIKIGIKN